MDRLASLRAFREWLTTVGVGAVNLFRSVASGDRSSASHGFAARVAAVGLVAFVPALHSASIDVDYQLKALDELVARQEYSTALSRLRALSIQHERAVAWLRRHAKTGHAPIQIELAVQLLDSELDESLHWFAKGTLVRILDASECGMTGQPLIPDPRIERVRIAAVANPAILFKASMQALEWEESLRERPSPWWVCRSGDPEKRKSARAEAMRNMRDASRRLGSYVASIEAGERFSRRVHRSEINALSDDRTAWLDDRRLVFVGYQPGLPVEDPDRIALYLWEPGLSPPSKVSSGAGINSLCASDGTLTIIRGISGQPTDELKGEYPNLVRTELSPGESIHVDRRLGCVRIPGPFKTPPDGVVLLRPEHGRLKEASDGDPEVRLIRPDGKTIALPIVGRVGQRVLDYARWLDAYLITGPGADSTYRDKNLGRYEMGVDVDMFLLWPDGTTRRVVVPYGLWDTMGDQSTLYRISRPGLIESGGYLDEREVEGWNGVFLFEWTGEAIRLLPGRYSVGAISPNGCRVAVRAQDGVRVHHRRLSVIDVCGWN